MKRSFSNRIFGGVCGGLASSLPLNAWLWRLIFIVLTIATMGVGALVYVMMWWLLPLDSPVHDEESGSLPGLISLLLTVILIGLWFGRGTLGIETSFWAIAFSILAAVFLLKQMFTGRLDNIPLGLVALSIPVAFALHDFEILQDGALDIVVRALPAVLVFIGLMLILRYRVRFGSWIAFILTIALVAGLTAFAYNSRVNLVSEDKQIAINIPNEDEHDLAAISADVTTLLIDVRTLDTDVRIAVTDDERLITGEFIGSNNSNLMLGYSEDNQIASLSVLETQASEFPLLEDMGRGELVLQIPSDMAVGLTFNGRRADVVNFDLASINLERLQINLNEGDVFVRLPVYQPQSPTVIADGGGVWNVRDGNLSVEVPPELGVQFFFDRDTNAEPTNYDDLVYQLRIETSSNAYVLESRQYDNLDSQMRFQVNVSGGRFLLEGTE